MKIVSPAASQGQPVQGRMGDRSVAGTVGSILGLQETNHLVQAGGSVCKESWVLEGKLRITQTSQGSL